MSIYNLDRIFQPTSIAVIGASEKAGSIGEAVMQNLITGGFTGDIFPVHPRYRKVYKKQVYQNIKEIDAPVDLAVIVTPIVTVPEIIEDCAAIDCGGAIIISAGGKEAGDTGVEIEKKNQTSRIRQGSPNHRAQLPGPGTQRGQSECQFCRSDAEIRQNGVYFSERCHLYIYSGFCRKGKHGF